MNPGAETFTVQLSRDAAGQSWGFRLQGGADFATALSVQSVRTSYQFLRHFIVISLSLW